MRSSWRLFSATGLFLLLSIFIIFGDLSEAHSQRKNPLRSISHLSEPRIRTPSNRAHSYSSFDLLFSLHEGDQDVKLTLEPNLDLIPEGAKIEYTDAEGGVIRTEPLFQHEHKVYKGDAWLRDEHGWYVVGWARIMILRDGVDPLFEGAFTIDHDAHHIQSRKTYIRTRYPQDPEVDEGGNEHMVVWRDSDIMEDEWESGGGELRKRGLEEGRMCASDDLAFNVNPDHPVNSRFMEPSFDLWGSNVFGGSKLWRRGMTKRQTGGNANYGYESGLIANPLLSIGSTDGCPKTRQVALLGIATDCSYTADFSNEDDVKLNIINNLNAASQLWEKTFNISLALGQLSMNPASCPSTPPESAKWNQACQADINIETRLSLFSEWRGKRADDNMALWMLLTTCESGSRVGLAWLGQVCNQGVSTNTQDNSISSGTIVAARTKEEWKVMAHEIGHSFGANHDCTDRECPNGVYSTTASKCCPYSTRQCDAGGKFIMNPTTSDSITSFSACSVGTICSNIRQKAIDTSCLSRNSGIQTFLEAECGNGIVEQGEDCDCGGEAGCGNNPCCDAKTCKFKTGAVCDDTNQDCCQNCQFAPSTRVCRPSIGECDPEEKCSGASATCPPDEVKKDGSSCGSGGGKKCASGQCTSRNEQCRLSSIPTILGTNATLTACNENDCIVACRSPDTPNVCNWISQNFIDGTPCEGDGFCRNGRCKGSSTGGKIKAWIMSHKPLVIGIAVGVGVLLLIMISSCIYSCLCGAGKRRRANKRAMKAVPASRKPQQWQQIPSNERSVYPMPPGYGSPPMRGDNGHTPGHTSPTRPPPASFGYQNNQGQPPRWG